MKDCPLCNAIKNEDAIVDSEDFVILPTKNMKGHKERLMVVSKEHIPCFPYRPIWLEMIMVNSLVVVGLSRFQYTPKFVVMSNIYGSVPEHLHYVATDLDPLSDDFEQILKTPWLKVVDVV